MRAWIEVPAGWGWGPVQGLKTSPHRAGYSTEEYRVAGHVMLAVQAAASARSSPPAYPPDWCGLRQAPG